jgi:hemerythrin
MAIGVSVIDNQHQELFVRFNRLLNALGEGSVKEELASTISFLQDYAVTHFGTEESMMDRYSYPDAPSHKAQHAVFARDFAQAKKQLETSGVSADLAVGIVTELGEWLVKHIGGTDKRLGAYLRMAMMRKAA